MVYSFSGAMQNLISGHINQTMLVNELFDKQVIDMSDIEGREEDPDGDPVDIYQWLVFPSFCYLDYEKLISANIPVLDTELETWVGITSFGSPYELYVYPSLLQALFGEDAYKRYKQHQELQKTA